MIHIDGSYMEGGGQILRTALALSTLTTKPFTAEKIRFNRPKPGLKAQHLCCIDALRQLTAADVHGARLGATAITFRPGAVTSGDLAVDIGTAGSITLLLQSLLLPCMFADHTVRLRIKGGTDTKWSIPIDYFRAVMLPFFNDFARIEINEIKRGFYPKGQGVADLTIQPRFSLSNFKKRSAFYAHLRNNVSRMELALRPEPDRIEGISCAARRLKAARVAERQVQGASDRFANRYLLKIKAEYARSASVGTVITLWAVSKQGDVFMGADALGEKGRRAEDVGAAAADKLLQLLNSDAAVDSHLADNLIPLLALCGGKIRTDEITGHIRSNIYVCQSFLGVEFHIDEADAKIVVD